MANLLVLSKINEKLLQYISTLTYLIPFGKSNSNDIIQNKQTVICLYSFYETKKVDMFEKVFFLLSMAVQEIISKNWTFLQPNMLSPQINGSSCNVHAILHSQF